MLQIGRPFFSVIIPVYNKAPHIQRSVGSVLNQTYADFELIIVNDASTDNSLAEILKFHDKRISLFHRDSPGSGGYAARNLGMKKSIGKWVAFLDADDEWLPDRLKQTKEAIDRHPQIQMLSCGWIISFGNTNREPDGYYQANLQKGEHYFDIYKLIEHTSIRPIWTTSAVIKKDILLESGGFDEQFKHGGDVELWLRLMLDYTKQGLWLPHIGAVYHRDSVNMVTSKPNQLFFPATVTIKKHLQNNSHISPKLALALKNYSNKKCFRMLQRKVQFEKCSKSFMDDLFFWETMPYYVRFYLNAVAIMPRFMQKGIILFTFWLFDNRRLSTFLRRYL